MKMIGMTNGGEFILAANKNELAPLARLFEGIALNADLAAALAPAPAVVGRVTDPARPTNKAKRTNRKS